MLLFKNQKWLAIHFYCVDLWKRARNTHKPLDAAPHAQSSPTWVDAIFHRHFVNPYEFIFACRSYGKKNVFKTCNICITYDLYPRPYKTSLVMLVQIRPCLPCVLCDGVSYHILPALWLRSTLLCERNFVYCSFMLITESYGGFSLSWMPCACSL